MIDVFGGQTISEFYETRLYRFQNTKQGKLDVLRGQIERR